MSDLCMWFGLGLFVGVVWGVAASRFERRRRLNSAVRGWDELAERRSRR